MMSARKTDAAQGCTPHGRTYRWASQPAARRLSRKPRALARLPQRAIEHQRRPGPLPWSRNRCVQPRHSLSRESSSDCRRSMILKASVSCRPPIGPGLRTANPIAGHQGGVGNGGLDGGFQQKCILAQRGRPPRRPTARHRRLPAAARDRLAARCRVARIRLEPAEAKLVDESVSRGKGVRVPRLSLVGDGVQEGQRRMSRDRYPSLDGPPSSFIASIASAFRHVAPTLSRCYAMIRRNRNDAIVYSYIARNSHGFQDRVRRRNDPGERVHWPSNRSASLFLDRGPTKPFT
jgi:hypothetical protein